MFLLGNSPRRNRNMHCSVNITFVNYVEENYIRGCFNNILKHNFNEAMIYSFIYYLFYYIY